MKRNFKPRFPHKITYEVIENVVKENVEKYLAVHRPEYELYALNRDPNEFGNVYNCPTYREIRKSLAERLNHCLRSSGEPILAGDIPCPKQKPLKWVWEKECGRFHLKDRIPERTNNKTRIFDHG